jgi:deazaflavin-dependent oxidoreductase (nitroreductase family)
MANGIQDFNKKIIDEFRANQGKVGGQFNGMPILLLTTKGAKSGLSRTNPLAYLSDGDRYVIIASYAGAPKNPPWYHNLAANPKVRVEVGGQSFDAMAEVVKEPERSALYQKVEAAMPVFSEYKRKTQRSIPVIALRRAP